MKTLFFILVAFTVNAQVSKALVLEIDPHTFWGIVQFSKEDIRKVDIRSINPINVVFSRNSKRTIRQYNRLAAAIQRRYRR